jgi:hypothetical protein
VRNARTGKTSPPIGALCGSTSTLSIRLHGVPPATPKFVSRSDPAAQWTGAHKGHAFFAYADNYLIDLKAAVILDLEATRAIRQAEVGAFRQKRSFLSAQQR